MTYLPTPLIKRLIAFVIDAIVVIVVILAIIWPFESIRYGFTEVISVLVNNLVQTSTVNQEIINLTIIFIVLSLIVSFLCWVIVPGITDGQTIGMKLIGIQIRRSMPDGSLKSTKGMYAIHLLRWVGSIIWELPPLLLLDAILILISEKNQRLGDMLANTIVVYKKT
ncbi:MAG: RDD family protein [Candidatus Hermodarchaeota archaeon]